MNASPNPASNISISSPKIDSSITSTRIQSQSQSQGQSQFEHQSRPRRRLSQLPPFSPSSRRPPPSASPPAPLPASPPRPAHPAPLPPSPLDLDSFQKFLNSYQTHTHNLKETHTHWLSLRTQYIAQISHQNRKHTCPYLSFGRWITQTYHELTREMIISMIKYEFEPEYTNEIGKRVKAEIRKLTKRLRVTVWDLCFALGRDVLVSMRALVVLNGLCRQMNGRECELRLRLEGLIPKLEEQVWMRYLARDQHASADMTRFAPADVLKACAAMKADNLLLKGEGRDEDREECEKKENKDGNEEMEEGKIGAKEQPDGQMSGRTTTLQNWDGTKDGDCEHKSEIESERNNERREKEYDYDEGYGYDGADTSTDDDESMDIIRDKNDTINEFHKAFGSHIQDHQLIDPGAQGKKSSTPVPTCHHDQTNIGDGFDHLLDSITGPDSSDVTPTRNNITTRRKNKRTNCNATKMIKSVESQYTQEPDTPEVPRHAIADRWYESDNEQVIDIPSRTPIDLASPSDNPTYRIPPPRFQDPSISDSIHKNFWGRPEDLIFYSNTHTSHTSVVVRLDKEIPRLQPGQWLNDELINLHLLWMYKNTTHLNVSIFDTFLYPQLIRDAKLVKRRPLSRIWFETTEWIIVPICEALHWYVVIVGNFSVLRPSAQPDPKAPFLIILDSMDGQEIQYSATRKRLADFLKKEAETEWGSSLKEFEFPHVKRSLKQFNDTDCGLYLLEHVERFLNCPMGFLEEVLREDENVNGDGNIKMEMRIPFDPFKKRKDLMDLILRLKEDQDRSRGFEERKRSGEHIQKGYLQRGGVQMEDIESLHRSQTWEQSAEEVQSLHHDQASKQSPSSIITQEPKISQSFIKGTGSALVLAPYSAPGSGSAFLKETLSSDLKVEFTQTGNEHSAAFVTNVDAIVTTLIDKPLENSKSSTMSIYTYHSITTDLITSKLKEQPSILEHQLQLVQFSGQISASMRPAFTEQDIWKEMSPQSLSSSTPPMVYLNPNISLREYRKRKREEEARTIEPFCSLVLEKERGFKREYTACLKLLEGLEGWERDVNAFEIVARERIAEVKEKVKQLEGFCGRIYKEEVFREMFKDQWERDMEKQKKDLESEVGVLEEDIGVLNRVSVVLKEWVENSRVLVGLIWRDLMKVETLREEIKEF